MGIPGLKIEKIEIPSPPSAPTEIEIIECMEIDPASPATLPPSISTTSYGCQQKNRKRADRVEAFSSYTLQCWSDLQKWYDREELSTAESRTEKGKRRGEREKKKKREERSMRGLCTHVHARPYTIAHTQHACYTSTRVRRKEVR